VNRALRFSLRQAGMGCGFNEDIDNESFDCFAVPHCFAGTTGGPEESCVAPRWH
jgi:hypothetical protein